MDSCRPWPASRDVIRAWSCRGGGALDHACHQRCRAIPGASQARTARIARGSMVAAGAARRARDPLSPPPAPGAGGVADDGGGWAVQAAQQKLNAQLTRAWCRRMAMSERTSALAERRRIMAVI